MKLLIATCADDSVKEYSQHTIPIFRTYAKECGADFKILSDLSYKGKGMWNFRTMIFYDLFEVYDRIFYLDSDIVINKNCPNIFYAVPIDTVGLVLEDKGSRLANRQRRIVKIKARYDGNENWTVGFPNGGLYIVSKVHREIFTKIRSELYDGSGLDGSHYMYQIKKQDHKYIDLGYKWNHMAMFSESWNGSPSRFDSYIIHYAGRAKFPDIGHRTRTQLIKDDIMKIYGEDN